MKILREHIQSNPEILFIFGDNDVRRGLGGMAKEFRNEPNSQGVRTKHFPTTKEDAYYTDINYDENCKKIAEDCTTILNRASSYVAVFIPDGIGDGLALLEVKAPKTYEYLKASLQNVVEHLEKKGK